MYYAYALYNSKHNKIYIGQTENLEERLRIHERRLFKHSFTAKFGGEWILIYKERVGDRKQALLREKQLKSYRERIYQNTYSAVAQW